MPNSLKCIIKKWQFQGKLSENEMYTLLEKIEGHDKVMTDNAVYQFANWLSDEGWLNEIIIDYDYDETPELDYKSLDVETVVALYKGWKDK